MATVKIYKTDITRSKNGIFDDLATYLGTLTEVYDFANVQHQKIAMDLSIKLEIPQDKLGVANGNYLDLYQDNQHFYFFITSAVWTSKDVLQFVLSLDTLNTFKDYRFNSKTMINRQHKDRFNKKTYPAHTQEITSWLNDTAVWDWSTAAGEIIGKAEFIIDSDFTSREADEITINEITIQGQGADSYEYDIDLDKKVIHIIAYVQGEQSEVPVGEIKFTLAANVKYTDIYRKIDIQSEGIEVPLFKILEDTLYEKDTTYGGNDSNSYYLVYKAKNAYTANDNDKFIYDNPIELYLCGDYITKWLPSTGLEVSGNDLTIDKTGSIICLPTGAEGKRMFNSFPLLTTAETIPQTVDIEIYYDNNHVATTNVNSNYVSSTNHNRLKQNCLILCRNEAANEYQIRRYRLKRDNFPEDINLYPGYKIIYSFTDKTKLKLKFSTPEVYIYHTLKTDAVISDAGSWWRRYHEKYDSSATEHFVGTQTTSVDVNGINKWDRTSPQLVKIINIPYCPLDRNYEQTSLLYDSGNIKYDFANLSFPTNIERTLFFQPETTGIAPAKVVSLDSWDYVAIQSASPTDYRNDTLTESKLYHSDFQHVDFVYDNFSYMFRNELVDTLWAQGMVSVYDNELFTKYTVSNTVASTFMFGFDTYWRLNEGLQNYDSLVVINRNNEFPIYNNYYLNYLRNGYNYDVKNKQQSQVASGIGIGLSAASLVAGIALSGVTGGVSLSAAAGGAIGLASSLTSTINSSVQADRNLQQKLEQAKNQGASVQGADDIGLLRSYTDGNKAKLAYYKPSEQTYKRIADLFYFCGYRCDYQDIPDTTSRYWFNFIQCDPIFDESYDTIYCNYIDDIKAKFREGVTVYHYHDGYNFTQDKENWETWLIGE